MVSSLKYLNFNLGSSAISQFIPFLHTLRDIFIANEFWGLSENFEKNPHIFVPKIILCLYPFTGGGTRIFTCYLRPGSYPHPTFPIGSKLKLTVSLITDILYSPEMTALYNLDISLSRGNLYKADVNTVPYLYLAAVGLVGKSLVIFGGTHLSKGSSQCHNDSPYVLDLGKLCLRNLSWF